MQHRYQAKLPSAAQAGIDPITWGKLAQNPQCARLGTECATPCEKLDSNNQYAVELDHIVPKSRNGSNSIDNLQWLCACKNREKYNNPDIQYSGDLYFDQEIDINKLRLHQVALGYKMAVTDYHDLFVSPEKLLSRYMLLAWLVGAGKTVGMLAILFGINHVRKTLSGGSAKRIKRVLWLVHQRSLVESIAKEVETELTEHRIAKYNPKVVRVVDAYKWDYRADVIVACPQSLWDSKVNNLNDTRRAEILSSFDAIVVDEAHFGIDQYLHLSRLAPLAFKFAVTSTPMDAEGNLFCDMDGGKYRDYFALYSTFGYDDGDAIGIYKDLPPFKVGERDGLYVQERGGDAVIRQGELLQTAIDTDIPNNLIRDIALMNKAIAIAEAQQSNFDHHIMVRTGSISHAKSLVKYYEHTNKVCGVWSGCTGPLLGSDDHPWMRAKANKGRIPDDGRRVVITIDIGQFGINNRYCSIIVWLAPQRSMIEIIQRIGRAIRRGHGQDQCDVRLYWNAADKEFSAMLDKAISFIHDLPQRMDSFQPMASLDSDVDGLTVSPIASPLKPFDRVEIAAKMGESLMKGATHADAAKEAINSLSESEQWTQDYTAKATKFASSLTTIEGRNKALHIPESFRGSPLVIKEDPSPEITVERLISSVKSSLVKPQLSPRHRDMLVSRIMQGDELSIEDVTQELIKQDQAARKLDDICFYTPMEIVGGYRNASKKQLPFDTYCTALHKLYAPYFLRSDNEEHRKRLGSAIGKAAKKAVAGHFKLKNFQHQTYQAFEKQLADAMMREDERRMILSRAQVLLICDNQDVLASHATLYRDQIDQVTGVFWRGKAA